MTTYKGTVSIGTGTGESDGDVNVSDYGSAVAAAKAALGRSRRVVFLPGTYTLGSYIPIQGEDVTIEAYGAEFVPQATGTSNGSVFDVTGDGFRLLGGKINPSVFVDSQYAIYLNDADWSQIQDVTYESGLSPSSYSTPMHFIRGSGAGNVRIVNANVLPGKGIMCFSFRNCPNATIVEPNVGEVWSGTPRYCHQIYDFNDSTHPRIVGGHIYALGDTSNKLSFILRQYNTSASEHHLKMEGGYYESIAVSRGFQVEGGRHARFEGLEVASFTDTDVGVFCAIGSTGDTSGTAMNEFEVINVRAHDCCDAGTNGAILYTRLANGVEMKNCRNKIAYGRLARVDTSNTTDLVIENNTAQSNQAAASFASHQDAISLIGSSSVTRWSVRKNIVIGSGSDGYQALWTTPPTGLDVDDSTAGAAAMT